jgi:hypothetical protein
MPLDRIRAHSRGVAGAELDRYFQPSAGRGVADIVDLDPKAVGLEVGDLGPVNTKVASANEAIGAQSKAHGAAKGLRLGETCNAALRPNGLVPEGLFPKRPCAALQSLAGGLPRLRFAPCSRPFEEQRIWQL